jgi:hypothetical protein
MTVAGTQKSSTGLGKGCAIGCGGLFLAGAVNALAITHVLVGVPLFVLLSMATGAIVTGRFGERVPRNTAILTGVCALFAFIGIGQGFTRERNRIAAEQAAQERAAADAARAHERELHLAEVRASAPETLTRARAAITAGRAAIDSGAFSDAVVRADEATAELADVAALIPPAEGAQSAVADIASLRADAAALVSMQNAIDQANGAAAPAPGESLVAWDDRMEALANALEVLAVPIARERLSREAEEAARRLSRLRGAHRRDVARARRQLAAAEASAARRAREQFADAMDEGFIRDGIEVDGVRATGDDGTTLRIDYALCGRVFLDRVAGRAADQAAARRLGFRRIECRSYFQHTYYDL